VFRCVVSELDLWRLKNHRCQRYRFRRDSPEYDCYVLLSRFTNLLSRFWVPL